MSQILDRRGGRPPLRRRVPTRLAIVIAGLLARLPPRRIRAILSIARRGAKAAGYEQALAARRDVTGTSTLCSGQYCLQRSLATTLLCRLRGTWPTWVTGVRMPPFAAHAWVEADGRPVDEPESTTTYRRLISVPPRH
ncbi:lasso peptide biosynthesis B2 protein [Streptomyces mayteni]